MTPSVTDTQVFTALRTALVAILPAGTKVVLGQVNRVPEPTDADFVVYWELRRTRLRTNVDADDDVKFTGSIAASVLTVTAMATLSGPIVAGRALFGVGVAAGTTITAQVSGTPGGVGVYAVSPSQTLASRTLSAGAKDVEQGTQVTIQIDVHGPNSADNAQVISTIFRDEYGVQIFDDQGLGVTPLYADDPKQMPFIDAEQQYEDRWVVEATLQVNPVVSVPQEYADSASVEVISVAAQYTP